MYAVSDKEQVHAKSGQCMLALGMSSARPYVDIIRNLSYTLLYGDCVSEKKAKVSTCTCLSALEERECS